MSFRLTPELEELQSHARRFAQEEIAPIAAEYDRRGEHPAFIIERAYEEGLINLAVPEAYGGRGLGAMANCIVTEELAAACAGITTTIMVNTLASTPLILFGSEGQMERFLRPLCEKRQLGAFCLTEREAGSDAGNVQTTAILDGDEYIINGVKCFISNGGIASLYTVFGLTDPERGTRSMSGFIVPADLAGIEISKVEDKMGQRASNTAEITFRDVRVPRGNLLGREGRGFSVALATLDHARAGVAALATGLARSALELATDYARERVQFGKPIAELPAIQFMLADMAQWVEASRLLAWQAAWLTDEGLPNNKASAIAKCFASDAAMRVTTDAVQIMGGYGYMRDYGAEKLMRDAKLLQIYEGTNQIQRMVIARNVIRGR
ncbi:MAG: acyl-CoA dehydrogenase family protein [Chloroflexia bacterium]|nr:acyl-CoA dehydrogenase family protein [Chloroflexia bacterium]